MTGLRKADLILVMGDESKIRDAADAVRGVLESHPVSQAIEPVSTEVGKALQTVGKAVNVALAPVGALVWGFEKIRDWLVPALEERLAGVPPERIVSPPALVAGPAIEALRYAANEETLRDLYANLLATGMDSRTAHTAHPAFVEILKQMSPDEARLLRYIAALSDYELAFVDVYAQLGDGMGKATLLRHFSTLAEDAACAFVELGASYLNNLDRLGLIYLRSERWWNGDGAQELYERLTVHPKVSSVVAQIDDMDGMTPEVGKGTIDITTLGAQFIAACVADKAVADSGADG